jgi:uncharacterized membrane protein YfcA
MHPGSAILLLLTAFVAGVMNAVAGGGSFLTFPALVFTGVPSIVANASSAVALMPAAAASAWGFRDHLRDFEGVSLRALVAMSLVGGVAGALLLLLTPQRLFDGVIPWLMLTATVAFVFGPRLTPLLRRVVRIGAKTLVAVQLLIAVYGGYFGGAVGIMMLSAWSLFGLNDLKRMNATKTILAATMNGVAVVCFVIAGKVWWPQTLVMLAGSVTGGWLGAHLGKRMDPRLVRAVIVVISIGITIVFFVRR